jgi:hypothetical protein
LSNDQRAIVQEAFAGLDVVAEFQEELEHEEGAKTKKRAQPAGLPGWVWQLSLSLSLSRRVTVLTVMLLYIRVRGLERV